MFHFHLLHLRYADIIFHIIVLILCYSCCSFVVLFFVTRLQAYPNLRIPDRPLLEPEQRKKTQARLFSKEDHLFL